MSTGPLKELSKTADKTANSRSTANHLFRKRTRSYLKIPLPQIDNKLESNQTHTHTIFTLGLSLSVHFKMKQLFLQFKTVLLVRIIEQASVKFAFSRAEILKHTI